LRWFGICGSDKLFSLALEVAAGDLHGAEVSEEGQGHAFGLEELLGEVLDGVWGDGFDLGGYLLYSEEAAEVHLLTGEVGHSAA